MPCIRDIAGGKVRSFWEIEDDDNLDVATCVAVQIYGFSHIPVWFGFGDRAGTVKMEDGTPYIYTFPPGRDEKGVDRAGQRQLLCQLTDEIKEWLRTDDGLFVLEVGMLPPMPVSVWLAE